EKLRHHFARRKVILPAAALLASVSANSVHAAPTGMVATVSAAAFVKGTSATASTLAVVQGAMKIMAWTKLKTVVVAAAGVVLAAGTVTVTVQHMQQPGNHSRISIMPDGSFIRLLSVSTGTNFEYQSKRLPAWQEKLVSHLPSSMASA